MCLSHIDFPSLLFPPHLSLPSALSGNRRKCQNKKMAVHSPLYLGPLGSRVYFAARAVALAVVSAFSFTTTHILRPRLLATSHHGVWLDPGALPGGGGRGGECLWRVRLSEGVSGRGWRCGKQARACDAGAKPGPCPACALRCSAVSPHQTFGRRRALRGAVASAGSLGSDGTCHTILAPGGEVKPQASSLPCSLRTGGPRALCARL